MSVSLTDVRRRFQIVLPGLGLLMFALVTWGSFGRHGVKRPDAVHRYVYWGAMRLDTDPLNRRPKVPPIYDPSCKEEEGCVAWDPEYILIEPSLLEKLLILSALPAFFACLGVLWVTSKLGVSQVVSFMVAMPVLLVAWYGLVGWFVDRWRAQRQSRKAAALRSAQERIS